MIESVPVPAASPSGKPPHRASAREAGLTHQYDWLARYVQLANFIHFGSRFAGFTMHKALGVPASETTGRDSALDGVQHVNKVILSALDAPPQPRMLDAGCGFGGTIFYLQERLGGSYDGLTLSPVQWRVARREARRRGIDRQCRFFLQSYENALPGQYDVIISIEALVYTAGLAATVANLTRSLAPGGQLVVLEDMPDPALDPAENVDFQTLATLWMCPNMPSEADYRAAFHKAGLVVAEEADLTPLVQARDYPVLGRLERRYSRLHRMLPLAPVRTVLAAYLGGIALERLYRQGLVHYRMLAARRRGDAADPTSA